jgi:hypothetical protein
MITVNIIGGLGNQMFQYACGRAVSIRTGQSLRIAVDQFGSYALHNGFELQRVFQLEPRRASAAELKQLLGWQAAPSIRWLLGRPVMHWALGPRWCQERHFRYWPGIKCVRPPAYLHGYWQSEKYFVDVADQIRDEFKFRIPWDEADLAVLERMQAQPSASLHVRRGDYNHGKNQSIYASCSMDYYHEAIRLVRQQVPGIRFFAFSDDPDWVETNLCKELGPIEMIRHNVGKRSANDMRLMSMCQHHIIANSSFSWWGAWLNPNPKKLVIAPTHWFVNNPDTQDLIPESWLRI